MFFLISNSFDSSLGNAFEKLFKTRVNPLLCGKIRLNPFMYNVVKQPNILQHHSWKCYYIIMWLVLQFINLVNFVKANEWMVSTVFLDSFRITANKKNNNNSNNKKYPAQIITKVLISFLKNNHCINGILSM